ncbi:MAG TPA: amino acid adenylation domain-containing protein, partial [Herpetosiphonaceae bacterium]
MNSGLNNPEMHSQEHDADQAEPADDSAYDLFPVSFAQQRLWFLHQLDPASAEYNMPATVRLRGTLNVGALELSLQAIIARHETLRTTFPVIDDQPMQRIAPDSDLLLQRRDLRPISDDLLREAEARRLALVEAQQPFDLQRGPLLRATLLQLAEHDYLLLLTLHHIVADGWSLRLFVHEIAAYYTAHVTGQSAPLPELPIQYADFAVWQRDWLQGEALDAELAYWTQCLGGDLPVLELPSDRLPTASSGPHGARHTFFIAPTLTAELDSLSRQEHVTLFMTLLAAFNVLLFRYTRQTDLLVGTPIANRNDAELEGLIGFFANTLVVRSDLSGDPCFGELLGQVRETMLNAYDHQDLPFEKLVEVLQPERDLHHSPLFQVMFVMQQAPLPPIQLQHLTVSMIDLDPATAKFDLLLALSEKEQGLEAVLEYRADRLTATMITRLAEHYQTLLHSIVASPSARLSELKLLSDAEHRQIIAQGCAPDASRPDQAHVIHMFEAQVARSPQAVAVATDTQGLSYAELNARANQLAHHLRSLGVGPGVRVALVLNRSPELLISVLGVLKAGAAYVPLDRSYPQERLAYMLADSGAALILTQSALVDSLPATRVRCLCLDHEEPSISHAPTHNPPGSIDPEQMAYVIYTSGSTGQPKGVAMPHRPLAKLIAWHLEDPAFSHAARTLHFAPISFDVSFQELFSCWATGGTLLIADDDLRHDPAALLRWMYEAEVERLFVPFVALHQLAEAAATVDVPPLRLREIVTAGEQLQITAALNTWMRRMPGCALYNHYGPTETHVVTSYRLAGTPDAWPAQPPIGRPLAGARLYVLEPQLQPAPIGVAGELYIGGTALAHGYLDQPALTAERFIADPFSGGATSGPDNPPGARIYRTGDMARYLSDGNIEFLGRIDDQVKVRGFRVEPGEIEAALRQHPTVRDAVVISQQHNDQIRLVAYVVGEQKNKEQEKQGDLTDTCSLSSVLCSPQELRQFLAQRLPEYMVPSAFVMLDALPLTPSGKLARRALSRHTPDAEQRDIDEPFIAPRSPAEELLANIWSSVLGRDRISIHDHFFAIGGHSLLATQIISRIRTTFNVDLPLRALFEAPTIAGLATRIEHSRRAAPEPLPPLQPLPRGRPFPLSFAQQRLWFLAQFDPGSAAYNIPLGLRLHGVLDVMALEQSLQALAARHETLRTTFTTHNGEPVQVIETSSTVMLRIIDLQAGPEHEAQVNQIIRDEERQPFDLQRGPLLRVVLLRLGRIEHVLLLTMHHIISDGWSMRILIDELAALYRASVTSIPHSADTRLPDLPIQYADFAVWQHEALLHSERFQQQVVYWRRQLAGAPTVLELPIALPRPNDQALQSATYSFEIAPTLTAELDSLSRQEHVTLFMTLLTAFNVLLFRYTRQTDLLVGTPIAGRNQHEIEPLIGFFVNTLVLRTDLAGNPAFANLLQRVRETALQAYAHQDLPFEQVVKEVQPERALHQQPLVQTAFVFQSTSLSTPELTGLELTTIDVGTETGKFDLTLLVEQIDQGLKAVFKYNQVLYPAAAIERLAGHFQTLLAGIVAQPAQPISYLPLLTLTEQQRQLFDWNTTAAPYPVGQCYHEIFETQVAHTPNAIAVIFGAGTRERVQLTYAELNSYANQLAHHLRLLGVTPETRVGICIEPSLDLVVALLGTLKAGGAYVPLDPNYPQERLQFMLEDAQVRVLLTQRRLEPALPPISAAIVLLDNWTLIAQQPITNPAHTTSSDSLAYMLYTSGSTGNPKGVLVEHKSMVNYLCWFNRMFGAHIQHLPAVTRLSFDASLKQLFGPLLRGAAVWLLPEEVMTQPALLVEALNSRAEVGFNCVPSLWSGVLDAIDAGQAEVPTTLTTLFVGGEPLHAELVRRSLA